MEIRAWVSARQQQHHVIKCQVFYWRPGAHLDVNVSVLSVDADAVEPPVCQAAGGGAEHVRPSVHAEPIPDL